VMSQHDSFMEFSLPFIIISIVILSALIMYLWSRYLLATKDLKTLKQSKQQLAIALDESNQANHSAKDQLHELKIDIATLESQHSFLQEQIEQYRNDKELANQQFQLIASKVLDEKSAKMEQDHNKSIKEMLDPLKERIKTFESRIEQNTKEDIARHSSLKEQIKGLAQLNERMTLETTNLTKALKGDNKIQGNWGELILENILQKSGLEKDREYFTLLMIKYM